MKKLRMMVILIMIFSTIQNVEAVDFSIDNSGCGAYEESISACFIATAIGFTLVTAAAAAVIIMKSSHDSFHSHSAPFCPSSSYASPASLE